MYIYIYIYIQICIHTPGASGAGIAAARGMPKTRSRDPVKVFAISEAALG